MRFIQHVLELISHLKAGSEVRATQNAIEYGRPAPAAATIRDTQNAIEWVKYPPNEIWYTQGVIEVAWPMPGPNGNGGEERGGNDRMLILDLSAAREALPDYEPAAIPDY
jgi:hypothetical protein